MDTEDPKPTVPEEVMTAGVAVVLLHRWVDMFPHGPRIAALIEQLSSRGEGFNWQAAFHKEHADLCRLERENYLLRQQLAEIRSRAQDLPI